MRGNLTCLSNGDLPFVIAAVDTQKAVDIQAGDTVALGQADALILHLGCRNGDDLARPRSDGQNGSGTKSGRRDYAALTLPMNSSTSVRKVSDSCDNCVAASSTSPRAREAGLISLSCGR